MAALTTSMSASDAAEFETELELEPEVVVEEDNDDVGWFKGVRGVDLGGAIVSGAGVGLGGGTTGAVL
jgi:hypothetical protein